MARTRTFIAVEISDDIRNNTVALQEALAKTGATVKWVEPENLHVSLLFLGEVDDRELHAVCRAVKEVAATEPPFPLRVSGVGAFPTPRRPKILWAGITDGAGELKRLYERLEAKLLELGCYRKEERGYTPHLTLGRVKGEADGFALAPELAKRLAWDGGRTVVDEVVVFASVLEKDGPVYTVLGRGELTGK
jgi:RNA 2',3'-cyclic 3'-phosphodiesterase